MEMFQSLLWSAPQSQRYTFCPLVLLVAGSMNWPYPTPTPKYVSFCSLQLLRKYIVWMMPTSKLKFTVISCAVLFTQCIITGMPNVNTKLHVKLTGLSMLPSSTGENWWHPFLPAATWPMLRQLPFEAFWTYNQCCIWLFPFFLVTKPKKKHHVQTCMSLSPYGSCSKPKQTPYLLHM